MTKAKKKPLGISTGVKKDKRSMINFMKKEGAEKGKLILHVGTERVETRKEPIVHEASVLKQLKTLIEKNKKLIQDSEEDK